MSFEKKNVELKEAQMFQRTIDKYEHALKIERERIEANKAARATVPKAVKSQPTEPANKDILLLEESGGPQGYFERILMEEKRRKEMSQAFGDGNAITRFYSTLPPKQPNGIPPPTVMAATTEQRLRAERIQKKNELEDLLRQEAEEAKRREDALIEERKAREQEVSAVLLEQSRSAAATKKSKSVEKNKSTPAPPLASSMTAEQADDEIFPKSKIHPIDVLQRQIAFALMESRVEEEENAQEDMFDLDAHLACEIDAWNRFSQS
eukprot:PhF_6_TR26977/c0_g1_i1/m.39367